MSTPEKRTPRQWWLKDCQFFPLRAFESLEFAECKSGCEEKPIHVREVIEVTEAEDLEAKISACNYWAMERNPLGFYAGWNAAKEFYGIK